MSCQLCLLAEGDVGVPIYWRTDAPCDITIGGPMVSHLLGLVRTKLIKKRGGPNSSARLTYFHTNCLLKGHGNEADFLGFLQKLVPHESLTLPFGPFRFWLQIRGVIRIRKTTPRLNDTGSRRLSDSTIRGVDDSPHH